VKCFFCKGELTDSVTTHVVTLDDCIIIVKNVPCQRCDQCGETFFSDEVAEHLEDIVNRLRSVVTEIAVVSYSTAA
jgi:YgiT-type zinc finger domain-containing protein